MSNGKPEQYVPGPESAAFIIRKVEREYRKYGFFKTIPGIEGPYIEPFVIAMSSLLTGVGRGGNASELKAKGRALDQLILETGHRLGIAWNLSDREEITDIVERNPLTESLKGAMRWINRDVLFFCAETFGKAIEFSIQCAFKGQIEIFPPSAMEEIEVSGLSFNEGKRWLGWKGRFLESFGKRDYPRTPWSLVEGEKMLEYIKGEPTVEGWGQDKTLDQVIKAENGDFTLGQFLDASPQALMNVDLNIVTDLAAGLLGTESVFRKHLARSLIFCPVSLPRVSEVMANPNATTIEATFTAFKAWRDMFLADLILPRQITDDSSLSALLDRMDVEDGANLISTPLFVRLCEEEMQAVQDKNYKAGYMLPLLVETEGYFAYMNGEDPSLLTGLLEKPHVAIRGRFLPLLKERLAIFGHIAKYQPILNILDNVFGRPWEEYSGDGVEKKMRGDTYKGIVEFGAQRKDEIEDVTAILWRRTTTGGMHYLQSDEQISSILFDTGSIATRAGLNDIALARSATSPNWRMNVLFGFKNFTVDAVGGFVNNEGKLTLRSDIEDRLPGYFAILENIAVSEIYDLVRREKREASKSKGTEGGEKPDKPNERISDERKESGPARKLPRVYKAFELRNEAGENDKEYTPRMVDGSDVYLSRAHRVHSVEEGYIRAMLSTPIEERNNVEEAYRLWFDWVGSSSDEISQGKADNVPFGMKLNGVILPADENGIHKVRTTQTWRVPHPSPRVDNEERRDLRTSFVKRFRGNGTQWLEWLEYMYLEGIK